MAASVHFSLCGPLLDGTPPECRGAGVCGKLATETSYHRWGTASDKVAFDDGALTLTYVGGDKTENCPAGINTTVIFMCDDKGIGDRGKFLPFLFMKVA
jgi:hypothetical protein